MSKITPHKDIKNSIEENRESRIKRLIYRSSYTGTKETDKILGSFSREVLPNLSDEELDRYEELLEFGDPAIWSWASKQSDIPIDIQNTVLDLLIVWCQNRDLQ